MRKALGSLALICFLVSLCSCNNHQKATNNSVLLEQDSIKKKTKQLELPDKLFALKNITHINERFDWDSGGLYFKNPKVRFIALDSVQKIKLLGFDSDDVQHIMAYFVSKQEKIGALLPIIVCNWGDGYWSTDLIILDSLNVPVSKFPLYLEFDHGPDNMIGDSIEVYHKVKRHSLIDGNTIKWSELTVYAIHDDTINPRTIDSINYISTITPKGNILTKRLDSIRYKRRLSDTDYYQDLYR